MENPPPSEIKDSDMIYNDLKLQGQQAIENNQIEKAVEFFQLSLENDDTCEDSYLQLAKAYIKLDENQLATETLKIAYKLNNNNIEIAYHLGFTYFLQAKYDKAIKYFDFVIKLQPDHRDAYYYKAISLIRQDKYSKALKCFRVILTQNPNDHFTLYQQSILYLNKKEKKKATILLTKAKELGNPEAEEMLKIMNVE